MPFDSRHGDDAEDRKLRRIIDDALPYWGLQRTGDASPVEGAVLNDNWRVPTNNGLHFVRLHSRTRERQRVDLEHAAIGWAAQHGLPVNPPLSDRDGRTARSISGRIVAVFPWLDAQAPLSGEASPGMAARLGDLHAQVHEAFRTFSHPGLPSGKSGAGWDTHASIEALSRVDDLIRYYPSPGEWQLHVQELLRYQLELLESGIARPASDFEDIEVQPTHGDFHDRNVLFDGAGEVIAVVDWELVGRLPPLYEVCRAITFCGFLDPARGVRFDRYVGAYAARLPVAPETAARAVEMWWQSILHNTWAYTATFVRGNRRAAPFIDAGHHHLQQLASETARRHLAHRIAAFGQR